MDASHSASVVEGTTPVEVIAALRTDGPVDLPFSAAELVAGALRRAMYRSVADRAGFVRSLV